MISERCTVGGVAIVVPVAISISIAIADFIVVIVATAIFVVSLPSYLIITICTTVM